MTDYTDGNYYAMTLGEFVSLLIDSGGKDSVIMRVVMDFDHEDGHGVFTRQLEAFLIPNGQMKKRIREIQPVGIHKLLKSLMEADLIT